MTQTQSSANRSIHLEIENVGGIEREEITLKPGLSVLSGHNATNRTSLLKAIMALAGSDHPAIRAGTEKGFVKGTINGKTYVREVTSNKGSDSYTWSGEGYCDDPTVVEMYAFLLEQNEVRQTVSNSGNLREIIMRPVDTESIQSQIDTLAERKRNIESEIELIEEKRSRKVRFEQTIEKKEAEREELIEKHDELATDIDDYDKDLEKQEDKLEQSNDLMEQVGEIEREITRLENLCEQGESNVDNRKEELEQLQNQDQPDIEELEHEVEQIETRKETIQSRQSELESKLQTIQPLRTFIGQVINDDSTVSEINNILQEFSDTDEDMTDTTSSESVTSTLVDDDEESRCMLCGQEVEEGHYDDLDAKLRNIYTEINSQKREAQSEAQSALNEKKELQKQIRDIRSDNDRIDDLKEEIKQKKSDIEEYEEEIVELRDKKEEVEEQLTEIQSDMDEEVQTLVDMNREHQDIKNQIENVESTIEARKEDLEQVKEDLEDLEAQTETKEEIAAELTELRNRVDDIEDSAIEQFNNRMEDVLSKLGYDRIERIWIQKRNVTEKQGRRKVEKTVFDLQVVRQVGDTVAEDTIRNLSESEREVTGLIFALTGYMIHDVPEKFPAVLMDSVEMIDADRLEGLLKYYSEYPEYTIVAALPEDVSEIDVGSGQVVKMA
jgi:DNA repair exonuclease SbcCD ATPase subunit